MKWWEGLYSPTSMSLDGIFHYWINSGFPVPLYAGFLNWAAQYESLFSAVVILLQAAAGLLLVLNVRTRIAGALIIFVQLNVYLATYYQLELRVLNSEAMWIGLFFLARPEMNGRLWQLMTYGIVVVFGVHLFGRAVMFGDPFSNNFAWQHHLFSSTVMSSWPGLKRGVLWLMAMRIGPLLWISTWWIKSLLAIGLLTRYRLWVGAALLIIFIGDTLVWLNVFSCEGVMWSLVFFLWTVHELELQRGSKFPPASLFP